MSARLFSSFAQSVATPHRLVLPSSWVGHWAFGYWLIAAAQPRRVVELGTHSGNSLFCFAQSSLAHHLVTQIDAVDLWQGDAHAGHYSEDVFGQVSQYALAHYPDRVRLNRMSFDQALNQFADRSIDLLHIDGLHTYDAVRHDFESWKSKCCPSAIVLFHDTQVQHNDFGVWRYWAEIKNHYSHLEFVHGNGLGVLMLDSPQQPLLQDLLNAAQNPDVWPQVQRFFSTVGELMADHLQAQNQVSAYAKHYQAERHLRLDLQREHEAMRNSKSWRLTRPLRALKALFSGTHSSH